MGVFQGRVEIGRGPYYAQHRVKLIAKDQFRPVDIGAIIVALHRHTEAASSEKEFVAVDESDIVYGKPSVAFYIIHHHQSQSHRRVTATLVISTKTISIKIPFCYRLPMVAVGKTNTKAGIESGKRGI